MPEMNSSSDEYAPDSEILQQFREQGFYFLRELLPPDFINDVYNQIKSVIDYSIEAVEPGYNKQNSVDESYFHLKTAYPAQKSRCYDLVKHLDAVHRIATRPRLLGFLNGLTNGPVLLDLMQIRVDDRDNDRLLPIHQEALGQISRQAVTVWIPLTDIDGSAGGLSVVPGSHKQGFVPHKFFGDMNYHGVADQETAEANSIEVRAKAGDALIFDARLMHGSLPNASDQIRWTFVCRYSPMQEIPYLDDPQAPMRTEQLAK